MIIGDKEYTHPVVRPVPQYVEGVHNPFISLCTDWKVCIEPEGNFWETGYDDSAWQERPVLDDLGFSLVIKKSHEPRYYGYRKRLDIPADFKDKRIFLRFEGAFGFTSVYVDGKKAGYFEFGHVTWTCEITQFCTPGQPCLVAIAIEDNTDDMCGCFNHGGLKRPFQLVCLPQTHLTRLHAETTFDAGYVDAKLKLLLGMDCEAGVQGELGLRLLAPGGEEIALFPQRLAFCGAGDEKELEVEVQAPEKWDAEHPNLYTLCAEVYADGVLVEKSQRQIGFRQLCRQGNMVYLNGKELKLRGASRHDISGRNGRYMTDAEIEKEIRMLRDCNINYIRTSHYPPTESYMDLCDRLGIYVEIEVGFAFIARTLKFTNKMPDYADRYVHFFAYEMERDFSHPSLLIWGIANESFYGMNFAKVNAYMHKNDPGRLTKFSYPMTMQEEDDPVDLWSIHYINNYADMAKKHDNVNVGYQEGYDMPVLHDEFCHPPCYNRPEQMRDPSVRTFFGEESPERFWNNIWETLGCLGGAIWAGNDETPFFMPDKLVEWGIMDVWIRPKPEWWLVKKAFSPVRILDENIASPGENELPLKIKNRFCHTNLREVTVNWRVGSESGSMKGPNLAPAESGELRLPKRTWRAGERLRITFVDVRGCQVDEYDIELDAKKPALPSLSGKAPRIKGNRVIGKDFHVAFDLRTGLVQEAVKDGELLLCGGPYMQMSTMSLPDWELKHFALQEEQGAAKAIISGSYGGDADVTFHLSIDDTGLLKTEYRIDKLNTHLPEPMSIRVSTDIGGLSELGVYYLMPDCVDTLSWNRQSRYSGYPEGHIGRTQGTAHRFNGGQDPAYGEWPTLGWEQDEKHYILFGKYDLGLRGTNDFRSQKHYIYHAAAYAEKGKSMVCVESDGSESVRMEVVPQSMVAGHSAQVKYVGQWYRMDDGHNASGFETSSNTAGDYCEIEFEGTGIAWIGPVDDTNGLARAYVDGVLQDAAIDQKLEDVNFLGNSFGFDKKYQKQLYSITGLPKGRHSLRIEVVGEIQKGNATDACNTFVSVDCFRILGGEYPPDKVKLIINNAFNYPRLAWGNYVKPAICVEDGQQGTVYMRLAAQM